MSDAQFAGLVGLATLLCTGFGKLGWSMFSAWLRERGEDRSDRKLEREADRSERREDRAAMLEVVREVAAGMVTLSERVASLERVFDRNDARISGVHDVVPEPEPEPVPRIVPRTGRTPIQGVRAMTERPFDPSRER